MHIYTALEAPLNSKNYTIISPKFQLHLANKLCKQYGSYG